MAWADAAAVTLRSTANTPTSSVNLRLITLQAAP
ncbi:MAG: hypothetical protein RLZZ336_1756 [Cyanobacteriota bacterium]|jgi:hypothetical protein